MKEEWLFPGAMVPVDMETTAALVAEIKRLIDVVGGMVLAQPEQEPLTDKQILADETLRYYFGQNGGAGPVSKQGRKVVDAIEAIHGIKEKST